jgi:hypothetical protein
MNGFDTRDLLADIGDEWPDLEELDLGDDGDDDAPPPLEAA